MALIMFNCGQGDSMLLHPGGRCYWSETPLLIDAGPVNFTPSLNGFNEIDLLLTHSHDDHIGGVANINCSVRTLYIPAYFPEILKIAKFLARRIPPNQNADALNTVGNHNFRDVKILYEGGRFGNCKHTEVFNPPLDPRDALNYEIEINDEVREGVDSFSQEILGVEPVAINETRAFERAELNTPETYEGLNFIYIFLDFMRSHFQAERDVNTAFNNVVKYDANKISVVFKYENMRQLDILFTGDADKSVFNRLIKQGNLPTSEVLKVPHHGSKHNLSDKILIKIAPQIALVSHENGLFGAATDAHPNVETIQWLENFCGRQNVYYTNDVVKNENVVALRHLGPIHSHPIMIC